VFAGNICFRKPHKTHRVVADVNSSSNQAAFAADVDFSSAANVEDVTHPPQQDLTRSKVFSEHFKLPEGLT